MRSIDWEVMKSGGLGIISNGFVLYGASSTGNRMVDYLREMGLINKIVAVVDSDKKKCGKVWNEYEICSPERLEEIASNIPIVITSIYIKEIFEYLDGLDYKRDAISARCFRLAIHFDIMKGCADKYLESNIIEKYKVKYNVWLGFRGNFDGDSVDVNTKWMKRVITEYPVSILIHGIPKTGNTTLVRAFRGIPNVAFTTHCAYRSEESLKELHNILNIFSERDIRIITGVREPIEYGISGRWQNVFLPFMYEDRCFDAVIRKQYAVIMEEWFKKNIENAFGIDVFAQPFNKEKGYTIIKKGNVSVFVYRLDFLSSLEKEIGEFSGVEDFKLEHDNSANDKAYVMAYNSFLEEVKVDQNLFEEIINSKVMNHFYTEKEREDYRKKWESRKISGK